MMVFKHTLCQNNNVTQFVYDVDNYTYIHFNSDFIDRTIIMQD